VFHSPRLMYRSGVVAVFAFFSSVCLSIGERRFSSAVVNGAELVPSADAPRFVFGVEHHPCHCSARVDPGIQLCATKETFGLGRWSGGAVSSVCCCEDGKQRTPGPRYRSPRQPKGSGFL
jgi:hypothetical protein